MVTLWILEESPFANVVARPHNFQRRRSAPGVSIPFFFLFAKAFFFSVHRNFAVCVVRLSERVYEADEIEEN